ncbi:MAG: arsenate reductase ArsC [Chthoniobacterales bacterium]
MEKILFVCIHNSARSQMAEALLNHYCGTQMRAESAGLEPGVLNPLAVAAMADMGIDISQKQPQGVLELFQAGRYYSHVITVCDETSAERCPIFPGIAQRLHWGFPDPSSFTGTWEERLEKTISVREMIAGKIAEWCATKCEKGITPPAGV